MNKIIIPLDGLPTQNEIVNANRTHYHAGAKQKKEATMFCKMRILLAMREGFEINKLPANFRYDFYCKDRRTDKDNIAGGAIKSFLDGAQEAGLIENDGWQQAGNWECNFYLDKEFQRLEVSEIYATP